MHCMNISISVFALCMSNSSFRILITLQFYSIFWSLPSTALILFPTVLNQDYNNPNIIVYSSISILLSFFLVHLSSLMKISAYYLIFYRIQVLFNFWKIQMILINTYFFSSLYFTKYLQYILQTVFISPFCEDFFFLNGYKSTQVRHCFLACMDCPWGSLLLD